MFYQYKIGQDISLLLTSIPMHSDSPMRATAVEFVPHTGTSEIPGEEIPEESGKSTATTSTPLSLLNPRNCHLHLISMEQRRKARAIELAGVNAPSWFNSP